MASALQNAVTIAVKEFRDNVRSKRFIITGAIYLLFAIAIGGLTGAMAGANPLVRTRPIAVLGTMEMLNIVLTMLALIISADTLSLERKDRTILQLLARPVSRRTVVAGKFAGCLAVVGTLFTGCALIAYVLAAALSGVWPAPGDVLPLIAGIAAEVLLLSVYVAIGVLVSSVTKNPFISIVGSLLVWVVLFLTNWVGNIVGLYRMASNYSPSPLNFNFVDGYPIYAKAMIWLDPMSHGMVSQIVTGDWAKAVAGLPLWLNLVFIVAYAGVVLALATALYGRQDVI